MPPRRILFVAKHIWKSFVERSALSRLMHPTFGSRTDMLVSSANQGYGVPLLFPAKSSAGRVNPLEVSWSVSRRGSGSLDLLPSEKSSRFGTYGLCSQLLVHDKADLTDHGGPPTPAQGGRRRSTSVAQNT